MKNRINRKKKKENLSDLRTFFLACELKPFSNSELWSVIEPFAYDVKPAFIHGSLGIIGYDPETYSIIDNSEESPPLIGYIMTITHPGTILLLDKLKGFNGSESFNYHLRKLTQAYTDVDEEATNAWCYMLSNYALEAYQQIEQVEFGMWSEDERQIELLAKIEDSL